VIAQTTSSASSRGGQLLYRDCGGSHGRTGRQAIINHDDCISLDRTKLASFPILPFPSFQLLFFFGGGFAECLLSMGKFIEYLGIQDSNSTGGNRSHGEFFVAGNSELSGHKHIKSQGQCLRDLKSDRNSAPCQAENGDIGLMGVAGQTAGRMRPASWRSAKGSEMEASCDIDQTDRAKDDSWSLKNLRKSMADWP
jgi:hypothetical protein